VRFNGDFNAPVMGGEARIAPGGEVTGWRWLGLGGKSAARSGDAWRLTTRRWWKWLRKKTMDGDGPGGLQHRARPDRY
jgi:hypothetical protein